MPTSGKAKKLEEQLKGLCDEQYAEFGAKLIPNIQRESILGVRAPELKRIAKDISDDAGWFLHQLPHRWHEENMLHAYLLCGIKDFGQALEETERFLPYVTNWAVCDSLSPKAFGKQAEKLVGKIERWMADDHEYKVRFGISMLMRHFLDERFEQSQLRQVAAVQREEYYIKMMQAWYFATALAKQWDATIKCLQNDVTDDWVKRKSIQKALESYRVSAEHKELLRKLRKNLG